ARSAATHALCHCREDCRQGTDLDARQFASGRVRLDAEASEETGWVPEFVDALQAGPIVLDGGLATELERQGADLSSALWSARLLVDDPAAIQAAHREFFAAGAQVAISASYQASLPEFAKLGVHGTAMLRRSVALARAATDGVTNRWVAA